MEKLIINGGKRLNGSLDVMSAKNSILPLLSASILTDEEVVIHKCPEISDVESMIKILMKLGVDVKREGSDIIINASTINSCLIPTELAGELRSSIFLLGSIIAKLRCGQVAYPGGCDIGIRPIDIHIKGLKELNIDIREEFGHIVCDGENMKAADIILDIPSVGATENLMMASVFTEGVTVIRNVAKEPEIVDLQNFLNLMGADIRGAGSSVIFIRGVKKLHGVEYTPIPDRIVAGTYLIAGAMCGGKIELSGVVSEHIHSLIAKLTKTTCNIEVKNDKIKLYSNGDLRAIEKIETMYYPGFPTDLQTQMMAMLTTASGTSVIVENIFETRMREVPEFIKMGADIIVKGRTAIIHGVKRFHGADVVATDLRGGASMVLAGLRAEGVTTVRELRHIDRGYESIEKCFESLGADIRRMN